MATARTDEMVGSLNRGSSSGRYPAEGATKHEHHERPGPLRPGFSSVTAVAARFASMGAYASWCGMTGDTPNNDENVVYRWAVDILRPYDLGGAQLATVLALLLMVAVV